MEEMRASYEGRLREREEEGAMAVAQLRAEMEALRDERLRQLASQHQARLDEVREELKQAGAVAVEELHAKGGEMRRAVAAEQVRTAAVKGQLAQVQAQLDALRTDGGLEAEQEQLPQRSLLDSVIDIQSTGCPAKGDAPEAAAAEEESVEREQVGGTI